MVPLESRKPTIQQQRAEAVRRFPVTWAGMVAEWHQPGAQDCAWLMYSANYLLRTGGVRWAIDPLRLERRLPAAPARDYVRDLADLSFVLLTHRHSDHLDIPLIRSLAHLPVTWVIPRTIRKQVMDQCGIPESRIIVPRPMQAIELLGIRLTPFEGLHWEKEPDTGSGQRRGVPAMGYLVECNGKRWLFPGDTRDYDASRLPSLGPVDTLFAHVWLGRGCASQERPVLLDAFGRFCLDLQPRRVVLSHLREFGRVIDEYWDLRHAELAASVLQELRPGVPVLPALMGDRIEL